MTAHIPDTDAGRAVPEAALSASPTAPVVAALPGNDQPRRLTKGQRAFFDAVRLGHGDMFHRRVIEPIEGLPYGKPGGLVHFIGRLRIVGCNSYSANDFILSDEGQSFAEKSA